MKKIHLTFTVSLLCLSLASCSSDGNKAGQDVYRIPEMTVVDLQNYTVENNDDTEDETPVTEADGYSRSLPEYTKEIIALPPEEEAPQAQVTVVIGGNNNSSSSEATFVGKVDQTGTTIGVSTNLRIRSQPTTDSAHIGDILPNQRFYVDSLYVNSKGEQWYYITSPDGTIKGFVSADYVQGT